jgi:hypothetical protein
VLPIMIIGLFCICSEGWREVGERLRHGPVGGRIRWLIARNRWLFNREALVAIPIGLAFYCWPFLASLELAGSNQGLRMV